MKFEEFIHIFDKMLIEVGDHFDIYYENDNEEEDSKEISNMNDS